MKDNVIGISKTVLWKEKINRTFNNFKNRCQNTKMNLKSYLLSFNELYKEYPFMILFFAWMFLMLVGNRPIANTTIVLIVAALTIVNKFVNNRFNKFILMHDFNIANKNLDLLITSCIEEYLIMNGLSEKKFFTSDEENKMREEITNMVSSKISKKLLFELTECYNEDVVYTIIGSRIYVLITKIITYTNTQKVPENVNNSPIVDDNNMVNLMNIYNKMERDGILNQQMKENFR